MKVRARWFAFVFLVVLVQVICADAQQARQTLARHLPAAVSNGQAKQLGQVPATQRMDLSLVLPVRNQAALSSFLKSLSDPSNSNYRHFLSVADFTDRFGPTPDDYQAAVAFAKSCGFNVKSQPDNRMTIPIRGTAEQVENAFSVKMRTYQHPTEGRVFYSADRAPSIPAGSRLTHIAGLNNYSQPQPMLRQPLLNGQKPHLVQGSGPGGNYLGSDMRAAYYGETTLTGNGQSVALLQFGGYNIDDVVGDFDGKATASANGSNFVLNYTPDASGATYTVAINNVPVDGQAVSAGQEDAEEALDIAQAISMAPGLNQVRVYIGSSDVDILNAIASENQASQVSISWSWIPDDPEVDDQFFEEMAAQGQTVFAASGDYGAYNISSPYFYPAEDAYVTAVGGTTLQTIGAGGAWQSESAWSDSGGGVSPDMIPMPWWQTGVATEANQASSVDRNIPDVAMEANYDNYSCNMGICQGGWAGTSFAAPRWAGYMALLNQAELSAGYGPLGFLNPAIYAIGQGSGYSSTFHDIVSGNNQYFNGTSFNATAGYDLVTGWGSPAQAELIGALLPAQANGFGLSSSAPAITVADGSSASINIIVNPVGAFMGVVEFGVSPLPDGITASFATNPSSTGSALTVSIGAGVPRGFYLLVVTGTSNGQSASTGIMVHVNAPGFTFTTSSPSVLTRPGFANSTEISVADFGGFGGNVNFSVGSPLPAGVTALLKADTSNGTELVTFLPDSSAPLTQSIVSITGQSGSLSAARTVYLDIEQPEFDINISPMVMSIAQGESVTMMLSASPEGNYTDPIMLGVFSTLPPGITVEFNPSTIYVGQSSIVTVTASTDASLGSTPFILDGDAGEMNYEEVLGFPLAITAVPQPSFAVATAPPMLTLPQGGSVSTALTVEPDGGFSGAVTMQQLSVPGVQMVYSQNPFADSTNFTLTASNTARPGFLELNPVAQSGFTQDWTLLEVYVDPTVPFTLSTTETPVVIPVSGTTNTDVLISPQNGFSGTATLSAGGSVDGITATFGSNPAIGHASLSISAANTVLAGTYSMNVSATDGTQTIIRTIPISVVDEDATATPKISPAEGPYTSAQTVGISDATPNAVIYYTTDESTPTTNSSIYTAPITVSSSKTIEAMATASGHSQSAVASAVYTLPPPADAPTYSVPSGTYTSAQTVALSDTTPNAVIYYTTNAQIPTTQSTVYSAPITLSATTMIRAIAIASGYTLSNPSGALYTINLPAATPTFNVAPGAYTSAQPLTISDTTPGAAIYYTTNGATPTSSSTLYGGTISVAESETVQAIATASGYSQSAVASAAYTINAPTNPLPIISNISPGFTNAGGTGFTLAVNGSGFTTRSTMYWGASALATQYVSATQLTAQVTSADIGSAGTTSITVQTPLPGGGTSNSFEFEVDSAASGTTAPTITSTTATVAAGSTASFPVTLPSTVASATATCLNLPADATCSYSSATNAVTINTSSKTPAGTYQVTVVFAETVSGAATAGVLLPFLLLPLMLMRRRLAVRGIWSSACLGLILVAAAAFSIGCGGGSASTTTPPTNPTHQVTSSGSVTLTIQ